MEQYWITYMAEKGDGNTRTYNLFAEDKSDAVNKLKALYLNINPIKKILSISEAKDMIVILYRCDNCKNIVHRGAITLNSLPYDSSCSKCDKTIHTIKAYDQFVSKEEQEINNHNGKYKDCEICNLTHNKFTK